MSTEQNTMLPSLGTLVRFQFVVYYAILPAVFSLYASTKLLHTLQNMVPDIPKTHFYVAIVRKQQLTPSNEILKKWDLVDGKPVTSYG